MSASEDDVVQKKVEWATDSIVNYANKYHIVTIESNFLNAVLQDLVYVAFNDGYETCLEDNKNRLL
jgi:DNA-binding protein YbaB